MSAPYEPERGRAASRLPNASAGAPGAIRRAQAGDAPACASLLAELGYPAEPPAFERRLARLVSRADYRVYVAELDGAVAALGAVHVFPAIHSDHQLAFIAALVVSERRRGAGLGAAIVGKMEEFAVAEGCDRIIVTTANHREGAHRFYERLGYEYTGRRYAKRLEGWGTSGTEDLPARGTRPGGRT